MGDDDNAYKWKFLNIKKTEFLLDLMKTDLFIGYLCFRKTAFNDDFEGCWEKEYIDFDSNHIIIIYIIVIVINTLSIITFILIILVFSFTLYLWTKKQRKQHNNNKQHTNNQHNPRHNSQQKNHRFQQHRTKETNKTAIQAIFFRFDDVTWRSGNRLWKIKIWHSI